MSIASQNNRKVCISPSPSPAPETKAGKELFIVNVDFPLGDFHLTDVSLNVFIKQGDLRNMAADTGAGDRG